MWQAYVRSRGVARTSCAVTARYQALCAPRQRDSSHHDTPRIGASCRRCTHDARKPRQPLRRCSMKCDDARCDDTATRLRARRLRGAACLSDGSPRRRRSAICHACRCAYAAEEVTVRRIRRQATPQMSCFAQRPLAAACRRHTPAAADATPTRLLRRDDMRVADAYARRAALRVQYDAVFLRRIMRDASEPEATRLLRLRECGVRARWRL